MACFRFQGLVHLRHTACRESSIQLHMTHPALHWTLGSTVTQSSHATLPGFVNYEYVLKHQQQVNRLHSSTRNFNLTKFIQKSSSILSSSPSSSNRNQTALPTTVCLHQNSQQHKSQSEYFILSPRGIVEASPAYIQPYLKLIRLDRPIGTWLLFLPCTWSLTLAAPAGCLPDPVTLSLFALGSFLMRGAGCTINDMWDKDFDAKVARTKDRPLACGQITSFRALSFLGLQLSGALAILLTFNWNTIILGACSLIPCIIYPLMKRITYWPQAFLGITLNWGVLIAWSALHGSVELAAVCLYVACVSWTMYYDTVYSHQDKDDDILIGVKSTALKFGDQTKPWLTAFTSVMVGGLTATGVLCDQTWPYFLGVSLVGARLAQQIWTVNLSNPDDCGQKFRSNRNLGIIFWAFIIAANLMKPKDDNTENNNEEMNSARIDNIE